MPRGPKIPNTLGTTRVPGYGKHRSGILFVGEAPAREEEQRRRPFVGKSGMVLRQFAKLYASIDIDQHFTTNLIPFRCIPDDRDPEPDEIEKFWPDLLTTLIEERPRIIVPLGRFAARRILERPEAASMEILNARVWAPHPFSDVAQALGRKGRAIPVVVPVTHPAAGLHSPDALKFTMTGLQAVRGVLDNLPPDSPASAKVEGWYSCPPVILSTRAEVLAVLASDPSSLFVDTEGTRRRPWCLQFSFAGSPPYIIFADNKEALDAFGFHLAWNSPTLYFHSALGDIDILREMGIDVIAMHCPIEDTHLLSHHLGLHPKGLKAIATREGLEMRDYESVVTPIADEKQEPYLQHVVMTELGWPPGEGRKWNIARRADAVLKAWVKGSKSIEKGWYEIEPHLRAPVEEECGLLPRLATSDLTASRDFLNYAGRDPIATEAAAVRLSPGVGEFSLGHAYGVDRHKLPFVSDMRRRGMLIDRERLLLVREWLVAEAEETVEIARQSAVEAVGSKWKDYNPKSADQTAALLFDELSIVPPGGLRWTKKKTRYMADDKVLESLRGEADPNTPVGRVVSATIRYRELAGGISNFVDTTLATIGSDDILYPDLSGAGTASGRPTCYAPNILAFPAHSDIGKEIRACFVARDGGMLLSVDYSQIEMRLMAEFSRDPTLLSAYPQEGEGLDLHRDTAARIIYSIPHDDVTSRQRHYGKTCNFAIIYFISPMGLQVQLGSVGLKLEKDECRRIIDGWYATKPDVVLFGERTWEEMRRDSFVREPFSGRIRWLPGINLAGRGWPFSALREEAERQGVNHKIQGSVGAIANTAMATLRDRFHSDKVLRRYKIHPWVMVYDDITVEIDGAERMSEDERGEIARRVSLAMTEWVDRKLAREEMVVPITTDAKWGTCWKELK